MLFAYIFVEFNFLDHEFGVICDKFAIAISEMSLNIVENHLKSQKQHVKYLRANLMWKQATACEYGNTFVINTSAKYMYNIFSVDLMIVENGTFSIISSI